MRGRWEPFSHFLIRGGHTTGTHVCPGNLAHNLRGQGEFPREVGGEKGIYAVCDPFHAPTPLHIHRECSSLGRRALQLKPVQSRVMLIARGRQQVLS